METKNKKNKSLALKEIKFIGKSADNLKLVMQRQPNFVVVFQ